MSEPIRVLQVGMSTYFGGTESFIMNQYRNIDKNRVQFDFLNVYSEPIACQEEILKLGGHIYNLNMSRKKGLIKYHKNLKKFFINYSNEFDVIHCNFQSLINIDLILYAKRYNIPVRIAHAHNSGYGKEPSWYQKLIIFINRLRINKYSTDLFSCSDLAGQWMFHKNSTVINNAIDAEKFDFDETNRKQCREKNQVLSDEKLFLFVGRLDPQKNPIFLLEIFSEILKIWHNSKLWIVGEGILKSSMIKKVEELSIKDNVVFLGNRSDVNILMQASDFFILPSKFEGLGIVLIEAQAAGLMSYTSKDVVPNSVKISDYLNFISLNSTAEMWAKKITENDYIDHKSTLGIIRKSGFDTFENSKKLQKIYIERVKK